MPDCSPAYHEEIPILTRHREIYFVTYTHRVGLSLADIDKLKGLLAEASKITTAANELAQFFTTDAVAFKKLAVQSGLVYNSAKATLNGDYGS